MTLHRTVTVTDDFLDALSDLDVSHDRTTLDGLPATLADVVDAPAVGVPLHVDAELQIGRAHV